MSSFKVAAVQTSPVFLDSRATVEKACQLIDEAAAQEASLVVFPEAFISGYPDWVWVLPPAQKKLINDLYQELLDNAVTVPDQLTRELTNTAKKAGIFVTIGINCRHAYEISGILRQVE